MPKDDLVYVAHMLEKAREAIDLSKSKSRSDFDRDQPLRLAITFLLQLIGQTAQHVSPGFRLLHREVPWDALMAMRHKIVHDYLDVDEEMVWKTVTDELAPVRATLKKLVPWESR